MNNSNLKLDSFTIGDAAILLTKGQVDGLADQFELSELTYTCLTFSADSLMQTNERGFLQAITTVTSIYNCFLFTLNSVVTFVLLLR